ncbi:hypothetical protein K491DRAFT_738291 [Lophiostoma macrostomum CBS 122681]|uniref:Uncharacterized protein n=1 Tax=Lophiostoma macrostomum CBS 122681 TaxID=1314788 RepID=A0A6A6TF54_9PLEO|nr:hypothetical protein K491DRAFT_738291 [Lophiostoma macrostomum CBS 122681]
MSRTNWRDQSYARDMEQKQAQNDKRTALLAKMQAERAAKGHPVTRKLEMPTTMVGRIDENNNIIDPETDLGDTHKDSETTSNPANRPAKITATNILSGPRKRKSDSGEDELEKKVKMSDQTSVKTVPSKNPVPSNRRSTGRTVRLGAMTLTDSPSQVLPQAQMNELGVASTKRKSPSGDANSEASSPPESDNTTSTKSRPLPEPNKSIQAKPKATAQSKPQGEDDNATATTSKPRFLRWEINKRTGKEQAIFTLPVTREEKKAAKIKRHAESIKERNRRRNEKAREKEKARQAEAASNNSKPPNSDLEDGEIEESDLDDGYGISDLQRGSRNPTHGKGNQIRFPTTASDEPKPVYENYRQRDYEDPGPDPKADIAKNLYDLY